MAVELECSAVECDSGAEGARWKTQPLTEQLAIQVLDRHLLVVHGQQVHQAGRGEGAHGLDGDGGGKLKQEKIPRPTISSGISQQDFKFFHGEWNRYKRSSGIKDATIIRDQLMYCPDESLRKHVCRSLGDRVDTISETELLEEIKKLAVERQSNIINTVALMSATQERDEGIRQFAARLRGLALVCDLSVICGCGEKVSVVERWILMAMVKGLYDEDTKQEIMSKVKEMSFDETVTFVEARETGKKSVNCLNGGNLASSQINRVDTPNKGEGKSPRAEQERCKYCGTKGHGRNPNFDLKKLSCPAFNNKCRHCKRKGHFQDFCTRMKDNDATKENTVEGKTVQVTKVCLQNQKCSQMGMISRTYLNQMKKQQNMTKLGHEEWSDSLQTYVEMKVPNEPRLNFKMCVDIKVYAKHRPPLNCLVTEVWYNSLKNGQQVDVDMTATADTGAQVTIMGTDHLKKFGLQIQHLLRSKMTLNCANNSLAGNLGVFFARIKGRHYKTNELIETKSMVYVIPGDAMLLSSRTLKKLGCIEEEFPEVGKFLDRAEVSTVESKPATQLRQPEGECDPESDIPCSCPRRGFSDPPTDLPMPATKSNRKELEKYIKNHFKTSAFNTCKRQHWPAVAGPPMKIHTRDNAVPVYHRKPTRVPLHFRDEVKAGLESDVKKGILRRVPPGRADTWCSRMVIQPKKNGKARRTVDLSGLSKAGTHESHHTRSAAEIAKTVPGGKVKTTLDCVDGYHGVELAEEDRHKTTFATEWGLFEYLRVPQGYLSLGDSYAKHTDAIMEMCPGKPE